ncbi:hypothetical protein V1L54_18185 [Streptomyces sp. TRM 70361]|uniref:hypothetical protein n=1 Tax=Streptomyces sp. TRM 70361 TaxID=3116553 RepID=UPI002E7B25AC|nr:hypothetical protein [Streptomyces sp. TRM 70361]MEE1941313.1 hypothetical protein [Streptomyces sp. TRM 70361]
MGGTDRHHDDREDRGDRRDAAAAHRPQGERTDPADRGPGAHSGRETQMEHRVVPGTASAAEGFSGGGTVAGEPLKGVEAEAPQDAARAADTVAEKAEKGARERGTAAGGGTHGEGAGRA